jgi:hypothetical protein
VSEPGKLSSDAPIERAADDVFGYAPFAQALAKAIREMAPSDGFVMAIQGAWGQGKTSAINLVVEAVKKQDAEKNAPEVVIVRFNPWWFSGLGHIAQVFFDELQRAIGDHLSVEARILFGRLRRGIDKYGDVSAAASDAAFSSGFASLGRALAALLLRPAQEDNSLSKTREKLSLSLRNSTRRYLIIIDDLDRLVPEEIRQILKLIKSVTNLPNVIYLLGYDRDLLSRLLKDGGISAGHDYLIKIVQVPFDLPIPTRHMIDNFLTEKVKEVVGDDPTRTDLHSNRLQEAVRPYLRSPREVIRLVNALRVVWAIVRGLVHVGELVTIETIRLFDPRLYNFIVLNRGALTRASSSGKKMEEMLDDDNSCSIRDFLSNLTREDEPPRGINRWKIIESLFISELSNINPGSSTRQSATLFHHLGVRNPDRFDIYLRVWIQNAALTAKEIEDALIDAADRPATVKRLIKLIHQVRSDKRSNISAIINEFTSRLQNFGPQQAESLILALTETADEVGLAIGPYYA